MAADLTKVHPTLRAKAQELKMKAKAAGIDIIISQGLRTKAEQDALYAQGRTKPGKIVTKVSYPNSLHCWGVAFDFAVIIDGKANWTRKDLYNAVGKMGEGMGLEWGGHFKSLVDMPHFQLKGFDLSAIKAKYKTPEAFIKSWGVK